MSLAQLGPTFLDDFFRGLMNEGSGCGEVNNCLGTCPQVFMWERRALVSISSSLASGSPYACCDILHQICATDCNFAMKGKYYYYVSLSYYIVININILFIVWAANINDVGIITLWLWRCKSWKVVLTFLWYTLSDDKAGFPLCLNPKTKSIQEGRFIET